MCEALSRNTQEGKLIAASVVLSALSLPFVSFSDLFAHTSRISLMYIICVNVFNRPQIRRHLGPVVPAVPHRRWVLCLLRLMEWKGQDLVFLSRGVSQVTQSHTHTCQTSTFCNAHTDDAILLFNRCRSGLKPDGLVFVKENICKCVCV